MVRPKGIESTEPSSERSSDSDNESTATSSETATSDAQFDVYVIPPKKRSTAWDTFILFVVAGLVLYDVSYIFGYGLGSGLRDALS